MANIALPISEIAKIHFRTFELIVVFFSFAGGALGFDCGLRLFASRSENLTFGGRGLNALIAMPMFYVSGMTWLLESPLDPRRMSIEI